MGFKLGRPNGLIPSLNRRPQFCDNDFVLLLHEAIHGCFFCWGGGGRHLPGARGPSGHNPDNFRTARQLQKTGSPLTDEAGNGADDHTTLYQRRAQGSVGETTMRVSATSVLVSLEPFVGAACIHCIHTGKRCD